MPGYFRSVQKIGQIGGQAFDLPQGTTGAFLSSYRTEKVREREAMLNVREIRAERPISVPTTVVDLKHLIVKLRWIGLEGDALRLHHLLDRIAPGECADLWPIDTD